MTPEEQIQIEVKKREESIQLHQELNRYYQDLAFAVKDSAGQKILIEINSQLNDLQVQLQNVALKPLDAPYYEYHKDDLQKLKSYRAQISILNTLMATFNYDTLIAKSMKAINVAEKLKAGEPLEARY